MDSDEDKSEDEDVCVRKCEYPVSLQELARAKEMQSTVSKQFIMCRVRVKNKDSVCSTTLI